MHIRKTNNYLNQKRISYSINQKELQMKTIKDKHNSKLLVASPSVNKYKIWLVLGILLVILILGVVLFYIVRPEVLFGKGIGITDCQMLNSPLVWWNGDSTFNAFHRATDISNSINAPWWKNVAGNEQLITDESHPPEVINGIVGKGLKIDRGTYLRLSMNGLKEQQSFTTEAWILPTRKESGDS